MNIEDMNQINDMSCEGRQTMKRSLLAITFGNSVPVLLINLCRNLGAVCWGSLGEVSLLSDVCNAQCHQQPAVNDAMEDSGRVNSFCSKEHNNTFFNTKCINAGVDI